jgi:methionyl-tRNA formyltransferase
MKILFAGTPQTAADVLAELVSSGHDIVSVLTREDAPVGRKRVITASAVAQVAESLGIPVIKANRISESTRELINISGAELGVIVAYGVILDRASLDCLNEGWFNLHYSLLPKYRGAAPVQWAIKNGDKETGITFFKLDEGMDTGEILGSLPVIIESTETSGELLHRLKNLAISLLNQELPKIYNSQATFAKQIGEPSLAPKPSREMARISFQENSEVIANLVRAMNPEPMAWCNYKGEPFRMIRSRVAVSSSDSVPGTVQLVAGKVLVACGHQTALELLEVQPSSKTVMPAIDWFRGFDQREVLL